MFEEKEHTVGLVWKDVELDLEAVDMQKDEKVIEDSARDMHGKEDTVDLLRIDDGSEFENNVDMFVEKGDADTVDFWLIDDRSEQENAGDMFEEEDAEF